MCIMNEQELEDFLYQQIPITKAMGIKVLEFTESKVRLSAKLEPNKNDKRTAFGGSINSLMTICGWALAFKNIKKIDTDAHIVIHKSNIKYLKPIWEDFVAECSLLDEEGRTKFLNAYERHKKSRIKLHVQCSKEDTLLAEYEGEYVAYS